VFTVLPGQHGWILAAKDVVDNDWLVLVSNRGAFVVTPARSHCFECATENHLPYLHLQSAGAGTLELCHKDTPGSFAILVDTGANISVAGAGWRDTLGDISTATSTLNVVGGAAVKTIGTGRATLTYPSSVPTLAVGRSPFMHAGTSAAGLATALQAPLTRKQGSPGPWGGGGDPEWASYAAHLSSGS
jgi:hypothetical protein